MKRVYLDTETTGFKPGQIGQLSLIEQYDNGSIRAANYFFDIEYLEEGAAKACGRDLDFYKKASNGLKFDYYRDEIANILSNSLIIAHNAKFDLNFLSIEFWRTGLTFNPEHTFCTMEFFTEICKIPNIKYPSKYKYPKLSELAEYLNIDTEEVLKFTKSIFNLDDSYSVGLHDSRYDTALMFISTMVYHDLTNGNNTWIKRFKKE